MAQKDVETGAGPAAERERQASLENRERQDQTRMIRAVVRGEGLSREALPIIGVEHTAYGIVVYVGDEALPRRAPSELPCADQEGDAGFGARVEAEVTKLKRSVELEHEHVLTEQQDLNTEQAEALAVFAERRDQLMRRREPLEKFMQDLRAAKADF
jgi:hypothetical protein